MKITDKIKRIEYCRHSEYGFYPGSLAIKLYLAEKNKIGIDYRGIYDWKKFEYTKHQSRPFLYPKS